MIRQQFMNDRPKSDSQGFRMRGIQVSRLEGISDAVFGLAFTLIVVSLKTPESFKDLVKTLQGFVGSGACAILLMQIWNRHYLFFRRYALEDGITRILNSTLLFTVIAFVYPMKFVFYAFFSSVFHLEIMRVNFEWGALSMLFIIYGAGFTLVYLLFGLMYWNALRQRDSLELTELEKMQTRWIIGEHWLMAAAGVLSILVAKFGGPNAASYAGFAYFVIPVFLTIHGSKHGDAEKKLKAEIAAREATRPTDPLPAD